jgi:AraC-like DNA-binding protein
MATVLTTDGLGPAEREPFWRAVLSEHYAQVTVKELGGEPFEGTLRLTPIGRLRVAEVRSTGQDFRRTARDIRLSGAEYLFAILVSGGKGQLSQDDRQTELRPGEWAVYETIRPYSLRFGEGQHAWVIGFPRAAVRLRDSERRLMTARRMDTVNGLDGIASRFLLDLARNAGQVPPRQSDAVLQQASDLVAATLGEYANEDDTMRGPARRTLMLRIRDRIGQQFRDPDLGPAEIAAATGISTRYLHKLFEAEGRSVSRYVRDVRLEQCRRDLLDPRLARRPIAAIASACGFHDLSGFNRAFKQAYGLTPSELRNGSSTRASA